MKAHGIRMLAVASVLIVLGGASLLWADPPDRVGRIDLLTGSVSFHPASVEEWTAATLNYPLTTGDALWTDQDGEAEIHVGSTAIRLAASTEFSFLNLDDQTTQIRLSTGSLNVRVRQLAPEEIVEIDTPDASLTLSRPGSYRIDVAETGDTSLTVRSGQGDVTAGDSSFSVFQDQTADISGLDSPTYQVSVADPMDEWDHWCADRDAREDHLVSSRYVPREMIGVEDLDANGTWRVVAGYGPVWQPTTVVMGWAPYRYGHWAWVDPWGWTWVDDAPWGFAPFHYGRWAFLGSSWVWVPGAIVTRPVYAPALVVFVGGPGWQEAHGGGVGWFPLGPREPYVPPYTATNVYVRNVNMGHTTVVNVQSVNVTTYRWVNRGVPGAMTAVPSQAFVRAQPVPGSAFVVQRDDVMRAPIQGGGYAPFAPVRESVLGQPTMRGPVAQPPARVWNRPVVARMAPPPAPVPFAERQPALQAQPGRPLSPTALSEIRRAPGPTPPVVIMNQPRRGPGGPGMAPQPGPQPGPQGPRVAAPGGGPGPQPVPHGQPGIQQGQPGQPHPGPAQPMPPRQAGPQPTPGHPGQPGPGVQGPRAPQPGVQQGPQPGPRTQPGMRRGPQGQPVPSQKPDMKQQGGPQQAGPQRGNPSAAGNDDLKRKPQAGPQPGGPGAPGGGPGGPRNPGGN